MYSLVIAVARAQR